MERDLLERYASFLTSDTHACAALFAATAEYKTRLGPTELCFRGRHEIRQFLNHVPRQIAFHVAHTTRVGDSTQGELSLSAADLPARSQKVRFRVLDGHFASFEVLS